MLTAEARIETERPSRYLTQLCRHASEMRDHRVHHTGGGTPPKVYEVEWSSALGSISFDLGRCTLCAGADVLTLRVQAADERALRRLQSLLSRRLETMGRRDRLTVAWQRDDTPTDTADALPSLARPRPTRTRWGRRRLLVLGAAVAAALAAHIGLGLGLLTWPWAGLVTDTILAIVIVTLLATKLVALTIVSWHGRQSHRTK